MHSFTTPPATAPGFWITLLCLIPAGHALAHSSVEDGGLVAGLTHPVLGGDHFLAMFSVGVLSAQMGGRAIWTVPATFVGVMLAGGIAGIRGVGLAGAETAILISVIVLGMALALGRRMPMLVAMAFVGVFALFHGYAHGVEMREVAAPFPYALGFVFGTAGIHLLGVGVGAGLGAARHGDKLVQGVGACMILGGTLLALS